MTGDQQPLGSVNNLNQRLDLDFALQAAGLGVWELDPVTNQVLWDDRCRELFGLATHNNLPYEQAIQYIHLEDVSRVNQAVKWALNPQSNGHYDQTYRTIGADDGKLRWVRFYGRAYFSEAGELYRFAGVAQEVTQQILAQQGEATARQESQRQQRIYEAITASTPDLIYVFDLNYRFTYANKALLDMWGSSWENSIGKGLLENGYEPWHAEMHEREIDQVVATKQLIRGEVSFPHATLGRRIYDYVFAPVFNEQGEVEAIAGTTRDITDIKQAQEELLESEARYRRLSESLEQQVQERIEELAAANEELAATNDELFNNNEEYAAINEELEEANRLLMRSNDDLQKFAYVASHDLQEPLRKIQQFSDLLKARYSNSLGDELFYVDRMQAAASRMSALIRDLLDFSRVSSQRDMNHPISLTDVINRALTTLDLVIEETKAIITVEPLPTVIGDGSQLDQLFQNLLSNALKFRQPDQLPRIQVTALLVEAAQLPASVKPVRTASAYHRIDVADNGVGFDEKYLDRIFQVFQRLYGRRDYAGTGIGLAICEKVVANHGGAITASSQLGQGATFSVYLPA